jgi:hypothetical protein
MFGIHIWGDLCLIISQLCAGQITDGGIKLHLYVDRAYPLMQIAVSRASISLGL